MDFVKRYWLQIAAHLKQLPAVTKMLIASVLVIMFLVGGLMMLYAADPESRSISGMIPASQMGRARTILDGAGIKVMEGAGGLSVSAADVQRAIAALAESGIASGNYSKAFNDHVARSHGNIFTTSGQSKESFNYYKQMELSGVVKQFSDVLNAKVILSMPARAGFGQAKVSPTASVQVEMQGGQGLSYSKAKSIADFVGNAIPGMKASDVVVAGVGGASYDFSDESMASGSRFDELKNSREKSIRSKIAQLVPVGTHISVVVFMDNTIKARSEDIKLSNEQDVAETLKEEKVRKSGANGGAPGSAANLPLTISGGGGGGGESERETRENEKLNPKVVVGREVTEKGGGVIQKYNVSLVIPREHVIAKYKSDHPDETEAPDNTKLASVIVSEEQYYGDLVKGMVEGEEAGSVMVRVAPYTHGFAAGMPGAVGASVGGGGVLDGIMNGTGPIGMKEIVTGALGLFSLAFMFGMARNATRRQNLPSIEELAGIPPSLPVDDELVGEAEEHETPMEGMELQEEEIRSRKIADQIAYLVNENPEEAGAIFKRWALAEE